MLAETFIILLIMIIATMGPSIVAMFLGKAVVKALARNPSAASKYFFGMAAVLVCVEAIAIMALLIIFQLFSK